MKKFLSNIHSIDQRVLDEYTACWTAFSAPKKTLITEAGKTEQYLYFVKEGIQKSYYLNEEGKQHVLFFAYAPSFSGVVESFLLQQPSKYYLETITGSHFLRISYTQHQEMLEKHRELETLFKKFTEHILAGVLERHHELLAFNVEKRFKNFSKRSPHLFNMIPHKDIASYLRIDPTNFSKLMNSINI